MFNPRKNKKGFTLIELIIVIAIIAILAAIAIPSFIGITNQADEKVALANAKMIANAINTYNTLNVNSVITDKADAKAALSASDLDLWPQGMTADDETAALAKVVVSAAGVATVVDERDGAAAAAS